MSNKIYTIGREFGSGGKAVGEALAIITAGSEGQWLLRRDF